MIPRGPKGQNRTELISSADFRPGQRSGEARGRNGQNPIGLSFGPPVLAGPTPSGNHGFSPGDLEDETALHSVLPSSPPAKPSGPPLEAVPEGGRNKPHEGAASVRRTPERPSSRFLSLDEAALFDERAAIREYDGGLSRAAAERLAWLDVLAVRQLAAHASEILAVAS